MTTAFVSGATGFIAQHIVKQLLAENFKVVGTVRSQEKADKLLKLFNTDKLQLEIVSDLIAPGAFDAALEKHPDVSVFLHTASPVLFGGKDPEKDFLVPAIEGTKSALKAIQKHGHNVKRVVLTSSFAAVGNSLKPAAEYSEESWNPITWEKALTNELLAYSGSKTFAEKAAWEFVEKEKPQFTLSVVNPVFVFGPQAFDATVKGELGFSSDLLKSVLFLKPGDPVKEFKGGFIDVRDVAKAHLLAAQTEEIQGNRLLLTERRFTFQLLLNIVREKFPELRDSLAVGEPDKAYDGLDDLTVDNSKTKKLLGFKFTTLEDSVYDSILQLLKYNDLEALRK